ncbi:MAG: precorrin-3B C(17)-methyltransferase [Lachnospiraceae bacterium]|nr:precorrin-3B C(17)-methyltransferase [Lachnospiraceae bacterium]
MKLYLVGFGPGNFEGMTIKAKKCIENSDIIVGYTVYVDLIKQYFPDKVFFSTPMRKETDRVREAVRLAMEGNNVSIICSGDSVVYGMAGLAYEILNQYPNGYDTLKEKGCHTGRVEIEVVPGVTAAVSGSALLGAVLTNDFCVISLSDLITPWETIEKRIECAAMGDFEIAIYNPSSKKRADYLEKACEILLKYRDGDCVCGYAMNIGRENENWKVTTLVELKKMELNMFTTVFIGNSQTKNMDGKMVTPRGYGIT